MVIKPRRMRGAGNVARMEQMKRCKPKILVGKPERGYGLVLSGARYGPVAVSCKYGNKLSGSIKGHIKLLHKI
jgi:hypothetical protein